MYQEGIMMDYCNDVLFDGRIEVEYISDLLGIVIAPITNSLRYQRKLAYISCQNRLH
jgi:hypothetical protein